nr:germin-like protein 2-1 [Tanacetum cinerariifolium]
MSPENVAHEGIPFELFRSTYPGRHIARERYPSDKSPGKAGLVPGDSGKCRSVNSLSTKLNHREILLVNGFVCKDPKMVKAEDILFRGLDKMGNTTNAVGSNVTAVNINQLPGLNTFGISMNPGAITIADAVFGSNPDISDDILAKAFQVDKKVIDDIQSKF